MKNFCIDEILEFLERNGYQFNFIGEKKLKIEGFSSLTNYKENTITWIKSPNIKYEKNHKIRLCIVQEGVDIIAESKIVSKDSKAIFFSILEKFYGEDKAKSSVGTGTYIGKEVVLGENVVIGYNCSLEGEINIGDNTVIGNNVVISNRVSIGHNCVIQSLSVIGEDGYGYSEDENNIKTMIKHYGGVSIGNNVFIGNHVNIARATIDNTIIGDGVKIAPTTHIGHNNIVGENSTIICSQLFGSVKTGKNSYISSSVVRNQCEIGEGTMVGMGSVVTKDIESNKIVVGSPARVLRDNNS